MKRVSSLESLQVYNVTLLSLGWSMAVASLFILISSGTAFATDLQDTRKVTVPLGVAVGCSMLSTLFAPIILNMIPVQALFMSASFLGVAGAALTCLSIHKRSFLLLVLSSAPQGIAYGISNRYRFFATDTVFPQHKAKALAATVGGAVLSAAIGPESSRHLRDIMNPEFMGPFVLVACLWLFQLMLVSMVDYRLPRKIKVYMRSVERAKARAKRRVGVPEGHIAPRGAELGPIYTESTVMSPVRRTDSASKAFAFMDIANPLFTGDSEHESPYYKTGSDPETVPYSMTNSSAQVDCESPGEKDVPELAKHPYRSP